MKRDDRAADALGSTRTDGLVSDDQKELQTAFVELIARAALDPLASICANAGAAIRMLDRQKELDRSALRGILTDVRDQGYFTGNVIDRLRTLVHREVFTLEPLDVNETIKDVVGFLKDQVQSRDIILDLRLGKLGTTVKANRVSLHQIMLNLILKAMGTVRSMDQERRVTIESGRLADVVEVTVSTASSVRTPADAHPSFANEREEIDLGWAVAKVLAHAQGGTLTIADTEELRTTFSLTLPTAALT